MDWRRSADLPVAIASPSVVRIGECVYIGGGLRKGTGNDIFKYHTGKDNWTSLPHCVTYQHGLATLNGELVVIGGHVSSKPTNFTYTFRDGTWQDVLPPMPTPRFNLSTVSHADGFIIAAGGTTSVGVTGERVRTDATEIYIKDRQWYNTNRLPFAMPTFSMCVVGDICYILGGVGTPDQSRTTLYSSISSLLKSTETEDDHLTSLQLLMPWKQLNGRHPLINSIPVDVQGKLVALGGSAGTELRRGTRYISTYDFTTDTWMECECAQLPVPLYRPGVVKLDDNRLMVIGGQPKSQQFLNSVFIGNIESFWYLDV